MRKGNFILGIVVFLCIAAILTGVCFLPYTDMEPNATGRDMTKSTTVFSKEEEKAIADFLKSDESNADSVIVVDSKGWIYKDGYVDELVNIDSCRNVIISALYGLAQQKGLIDINKTLAEINFDDEKQPLTDTEKQAKISDLLKGRSGIYLYAVGDSDEPPADRPERGSKAPGEYYYYQNWDINALGQIFEQQTQMTLGDAFYQWVAVPTQMKYFSAMNVHYDSERKTSIPTFQFWMNGDDLARFAVMYLSGGKYLNQQIISAKWIEDSLATYTAQTKMQNQDFGFGYLWWTYAEKGLAIAYGDGGQMIILNTKDDLAIVITNNTGGKLGDLFWGSVFGDEVSFEEAFALYELALQSKKNA